MSYGKKFKAWAMAPSGFGSVRKARESMEPPGDDEGVLGVPKFWPDDMLGLKGTKKKRF